MTCEIKLCVTTVLLCCHIYELFSNNWENILVKGDSALYCTYSFFTSFQVETFFLFQTSSHAHFSYIFVQGITPVAAYSKAWVCGRSLIGISGSNLTVGHKCLSVVSVLCCQAEVSASGWSLVKRSPTSILCCQAQVSASGWSLVKRSPTSIFCLTACDRKASILRPCPTRGRWATKKKITAKFLLLRTEGYHPQDNLTIIHKLWGTYHHHPQHHGKICPGCEEWKFSVLLLHDPYIITAGFIVIL